MFVIQIPTVIWCETVKSGTRGVSEHYFLKFINLFLQESSNYGTARQYYQRASNIDTRNGRPFNQLAFLAQTTKRKFEAVYYNMRCLLTLR